jgi:hypothetical protein
MTYVQAASSPDACVRVPYSDGEIQGIISYTVTLMTLVVTYVTVRLLGSNDCRRPVEAWQNDGPANNGWWSCGRVSWRPGVWVISRRTIRSRCCRTQIRKWCCSWSRSRREFVISWAVDLQTRVFLRLLLLTPICVAGKFYEWHGNRTRES